jgi:hypothetical protein
MRCDTMTLFFSVESKVSTRCYVDVFSCKTCHLLGVSEVKQSARVCSNQLIALINFLDRAL